jgi:signal transduction histidine kinase/DNA-binding response OmpR family regulator
MALVPASTQARKWKTTVMMFNKKKTIMIFNKRFVYALCVIVYLVFGVIILSYMTNIMADRVLSIIGTKAKDLALLASKEYQITDSEVAELKKLEFGELLLHPANVRLAEMFGSGFDSTEVRYAYIMVKLEKEQTKYQVTDKYAEFFGAETGTPLDVLWLVDVVVGQTLEEILTDDESYYDDVKRYSYFRPAVEKAYQERALTYLLIEDEYGREISGLAPIYSVEGTFAGMLGVDIYIEAYEKEIEQVRNILAYVIFLSTSILTALYIIVNIRNKKHMTEITNLQDDLQGALDKATEANDHKNAAINSLESILNSIDELIYATDPETGKLLFVNNYMKEIFGKRDDEVVGEYCYKILRGLDKICDFCPCHQLKEAPEAKIVWDNDDLVLGRRIRHSDCLIDWPTGKKVHLQYAVDITELVAAKEVAEQSNLAKGVFIAQMSHEIRTPISVILGISEIQLRAERLSADAEEGFRKIYDSGNLLLNIVNDILDFSKVDAGKMEIVPGRYDIPSLVNDTVQLCRLHYESKPIDFNVQVDENTPLELIGDGMRIRQILNNLLSNAFKYTDTGEVRLSVAVEPGSLDETVLLVLKVRDTGQGMTKDQIDRIFDEYSRFNMRINSGIPGTGLGMNIAKRLVEMMEGEIAVESEVGRGTAFTVRLSQKTCGSVVCGADIIERLKNFSFSSTTITKRIQIVHEYMPYGRVLVVDDVESNLYVARGLLTPYELHVETAKSAFEAIERIKSGQVYDIVFMDHMMPGLDGLEATNILRGCGYSQPIVALTANAMSGQAEIFLARGFDKFISKPIDSRELDMVLKELIRDRKPPEIVEAARREKHKAASAPRKNLTELRKYFIKDAEDIIKALENISAKTDGLGDADMESYTIAIHGLKSALRNIGETRLSEFALKLEEAGAARNIGLIVDETPALLEKLKLLIAKFKPQETFSAGEASREDVLYLKEKLSEIRTACETFNIRTAEAALTDLKQKTWPQEIDEAINEISLSLLRGEFKKAVSIAENMTSALNN